MYSYTWVNESMSNNNVNNKFMKWQTAPPTQVEGRYDNGKVNQLKYRILLYMHTPHTHTHTLVSWALLACFKCRNKTEFAFHYGRHASDYTYDRFSTGYTHTHTHTVTYLCTPAWIYKWACRYLEDVQAYANIFVIVIVIVEYNIAQLNACMDTDAILTASSCCAGRSDTTTHRPTCW